MNSERRPATSTWRLGLVLAVVLGIIGIGFYFGSLRAEAERRCVAHCALGGKQGDLVPVIERMRSGAGSPAFTPTECVCR